MESKNVASSNSLEKIFHAFSGGKSEMSNKEWLKLNKDCGLIDKKYTSTDVDINFTKFKAKTSKTISFQQFLDGLNLAAEKKGITFEKINEIVCSSSGPIFKGTKADFVKFHDDKSLYTGVYAKGGPTNVDVKSGKISDISHLCDRTAADVRGVKK